MARRFGEGSDKSNVARDIRLKQIEEEEERQKSIERYASVAFMVFSVLVIIFTIVGYVSYKKKTTESMAELAKLQSKLSGSADEVNDESNVVVEIDTIAASAKDAGEKVCQAQNDIDTSLKAAFQTGSDTMTSAEMEALKVVRQYFNADNENQNQLIGSWSRYGPKGTWSFESVYEFEGTTCPVVWKYYADDDTDHDRLLACVVATYDTHDNMFHDGRAYFTTWYYELAQDELMPSGTDIELEPDNDTGVEVDNSDISLEPDDESEEIVYEDEDALE